MCIDFNPPKETRPSGFHCFLPDRITMPKRAWTPKDVIASILQLQKSLIRFQQMLLEADPEPEYCRYLRNMARSQRWHWQAAINGYINKKRAT